MAIGRDAADVAPTFTFGNSACSRFTVIAEEAKDVPKVQAAGGLQRDGELMARR